jgi:hypothetical protein
MVKIRLRYLERLPSYRSPFNAFFNLYFNYCLRRSGINKPLMIKDIRQVTSIGRFSKISNHRQAFLTLTLKLRKLSFVSLPSIVLQAAFLRFHWINATVSISQNAPKPYTKWTLPSNSPRKSYLLFMSVVF